MCLTSIVPMVKKFRQLHKKPNAEGLNVVDQAPAHHAEDTLRGQYLQEANIKTKELPPKSTYFKQPTEFMHGHAKHDYIERIKKKVGQVDDLRKRTDREKNASGTVKGVTAEVFIATLAEMWREYDQAFIAYAFYDRGFFSLAELAAGLGCDATEITAAGNKVYELIRKACRGGLGGHCLQYAVGNFENVKKARKETPDAD